MHLYTPPGYELGTGTFPVFYLLHGAGDNDESWTSVGRAGFILDNLIAAKKAVPMIVVMPAGHTSRTPVNAIGRSATDEFVQDFVQDVMPYVELAAEFDGDWRRAIREWGGDAAFYTQRARAIDEVLPWDHFDVGVKKAGLVKEWERAQVETEVPA